MDHKSVMTPLLALFVLCFIDTIASGIKNSNQSDWKLVWADEFDKDGRPAPRKWSYEAGFVRNREFQWYRADNAWCEKALLIIESRRERK
jgi:hypothetical protein